jgi:hypothetical protein
MKELWAVLIEKLKQVEPIVASIEIGILSLFAIGMSTVVICGLFNLIEDIVLAFSGKPLG